MPEKDCNETTIESRSFIASQVAEFINDKTLYHKFLEEVADARLLVQQNPQESFVLVQIMVKAGLRLMGDTGKLLTVEYETLFRRTLKSLSVVLSEHRQILSMVIQDSEANSPEALWSWLLGQMLSLLRKAFSEAMNDELSTVLYTLVSQLQIMHEPEFYMDAISRLIDVLRELSQSDSLDRKTTENKDVIAVKRLQVRMHILAILFELVTNNKDIEHQVKPPRLAFLLAGGYTNIVMSGRTRETYIDDLSNTFLQTKIVASSPLNSADLSWRYQAQQMLCSVAQTSHKSSLTQDLVLWQSRQAQLDVNVREVIRKLSTASFSQKDKSQFAANCKLILENSTITLSSATKRAIENFILQLSSRDDRQEPPKPALAPIFREASNCSSDLGRALAEVLQIASANFSMSAVFEDLQAFCAMETPQQVSVVQAFGLLGCAAAKTLYTASISSNGRLLFACESCDKRIRHDDQCVQGVVVNEKATQRFLMFAKSHPLQSKVSLRIELLQSWKRQLSHTRTHDSLDSKDTSLIKYINSCLEDDSRQVRIQAGFVVPLA